MRHPNRREVVFAATALITGCASMRAASPAAVGKSTSKTIAPVVHIVFFWLKNPDSREDLKLLLAGLRSFADIESVRNIHVGVPDLTRQRGVVDSSYSASIVLCFADVAGYKAHLSDPIHDQFANDCGALIQRAVVYDPKPKSF